MQKIMIAAVDLNGNIGYTGSNKLPWHIPEDLKFFKEKTKGHPMIMGYNTWASLPGILPGRKHYIVTKKHIFDLEFSPQIKFVLSVEEALSCAEQDGNQKAFIIGGAQIYNYSLQNNLIDLVYLTEVQTKLSETEQLAQIDMNTIKEKFELSDVEEIQNSNALSFIFKTFSKVKQE